MTDAEVGKIIRYHRKRLGLTQQELASRLGVTWEMVSRYERGRSSAVQKLLEIAHELDINPTQLLQESPAVNMVSENHRVYQFDKHLPIIKNFPREKIQLMPAIDQSTEGLRTPLQSEQKTQSLFLFEIVENAKVKIEIPFVFAKGYFLCAYTFGNLSEEDTVIANIKEVITITKYTPGLEVLAKVLQWIVEF